MKVLLSVWGFLYSLLFLQIEEEKMIRYNHRYKDIVDYDTGIIKKELIELDTIHELPYPNEMSTSSLDLSTAQISDIQILLALVGAPLLPTPQPSLKDIQDENVLQAKYILQQYVAAIGGEKVLNSKDSMYAMGKVKMVVDPEFVCRDKIYAGGGEVGSFVWWSKVPHLWCFELTLSGYKTIAGSDGKVSWRQTKSDCLLASQGTLRRSLQGLDPKSVAKFFTNSVYERDDESCFVLKVEVEPSVLKACSNDKDAEITSHIISGFFDQRTGLLVKLEDVHCLRIKEAGEGYMYWETKLESSIDDYRSIDGIMIAHCGKTIVYINRFGDKSAWISKTRMEEVWEIQEVDFNVKGLNMDFFLPPKITLSQKDECSSMRDLKIARELKVTFQIQDSYIARSQELNNGACEVGEVIGKGRRWVYAIQSFLWFFSSIFGLGICKFFTSF